MVRPMGSVHKRSTGAARACESSWNTLDAADDEKRGERQLVDDTLEVVVLHDLEHGWSAEAGERREAVDGWRVRGGVRHCECVARQKRVGGAVCKLARGVVAVSAFFPTVSPTYTRSPPPYVVSSMMALTMSPSFASRAIAA